MIKVLGASGSLDKDKACISFQLNETTIIDAGNIIRALGESSSLIEHVFLTHAHFDHILDLPFLIETHFNKRKTPLKIYALKPTLDILQTHIFNGVVWPKFQNIQHSVLKSPLLTFKEIQLGEEITAGDTIVKAIDAVHSEGACGYLVKQNNIGCLITGDTYLNPNIAKIVNQDNSIQSLLIDTSFPSNLDELATESKHLTPKLLKTVLDEIKRPIAVYPYHLKPAYETQILDELTHSDFDSTIKKVLDAGDELDVFGSTIHIMQPTSETSDVSYQQLQSLLATAQALSSETNLDKLLEMIVQQAINFSKADAGTLYRVSDNKKELIFTVVQNRSLDIYMGGTAKPISWENLPLYLEDGLPNEQMAATYCALNKKIINIDCVYKDANFNFEGTKKFDANTGYRSKSMLVVPLLNSNNQLLGVLQLINKMDNAGNILPFRQPDQQNTSALASQAAISLTNALLIKELETLFESVIGTITKAFDEKCSFTGGHVRLVAELSQIISQGIAEDNTVYKDINYSADDLHAIKIAALLHDVGKIATPEFIMQKSTKLEQVYDRINVIGARIEILKRDAQIKYLQDSLADNPNSQFKAEYEAKVRELDELYQFLKKINTGEDFLQQEALNRIESLTYYTYQASGHSVPLINEDEKINLSIRSGTLNNAEREKIMDHARVSLEVLQTLPFPAKYKSVVDIAANHHEKLDGSGYPRGLKDADISLEDRILILADLYEALSSRDRPYKDPNTLSQTFKILSSMANDGLIDKTLLRFFFESGLYKKYNQHLDSAQIDEIILEID